jgi:hypothetical protein
MTGHKLRESERWKHRRKPTPIGDAAPAPTFEAPASIETRAERVLIDRWVASRLVPWPPSHCFSCKRPIVAGQKWLDLVCDDNRARFLPIASLCGEPSRKSPLVGRCGVKT